MRRASWLFLLLMLMLPNLARAIQLHWVGGATDLTVSSNTQAVLVVQADSAEVTLPNSWRLQWTADSVQVQFSAFDPNSACLVDTAKVDSIIPPSTPADSAANEVTAYFCSSGSNNATTAYFLADLIADSKGKMKVVALNAADTTQVIESNEVTFNGGIDGDYAPLILSATAEHSTALLQLNVVGSNLQTVTSLQVGSPDNLWDVPLTVTSRGDSALTATASVPVSLPVTLLTASAARGPSGQFTLVADPVIEPDVAETVSDTILFVDPYRKVYPKDFAFFYNSVPRGSGGTLKGRFHLFYIRNYCVDTTNCSQTSQDSILAHAWCDTLGGVWHVDSLAFRPSGSGWDAKKCWAPSLQQVGGRTFMFYTGVDAATGTGNQTIGYAYTDSLWDTGIPWHRSSAPVWRAGLTSWADSIGHETTNRQAFRDPFVMPDPDVVHYPNRYLLFNSGEDRVLHPHYAVGVARNDSGTFATWKDLGKYAVTDYDNFKVTGAVESPMVMRDSLTGAWRMFVANASYTTDYNSTYFFTQTQGDTVTDVAAGSWPSQDSLYYYEGNDGNLIGWEATEHLQIGQVHYFAAYNGGIGGGIGITRMHWNGTQFVFVKPTNAGVSPGASAQRTRFYVANLRPGAGVVRLVVESPAVATPRLIIYDLAGRVVREVSSGLPMSGRREFVWNCRNRSGQQVPAGMYFARLTGVGTPRVVRVPVVR